MLLSLILIPMFGLLGAAFAVTVTMGVGVVITGVIVYRRSGPMLTPSILIKVSIATAIVVAVGAQLSGSGPLLLLQYIGLITLYAFTLAMLAHLTWQDLQSFALWQRESPQNCTAPHLSSGDERSAVAAVVLPFQRSRRLVA